MLGKKVPDSNQTQHERRTPDKTLEAMKAEILAEVDRQNKSLKAYVDSAFPNGSALDHKRYHDGLIKSAEKWDKIWTDIFTTIAKGGLWLLVGFVGVAVWQKFVSEIVK